ncbi:MAG: hypothetical protein KVP17_001492 [Porospora cf. gigantea B]|uniref:uncharacterized protein n=1 Tax=Porospora cf. gigantea B TaxID=2853592 RepID=UPI003571ED8C|nr:MAG: hypothetical protein KVP17_001492 [Porospora cf. gigantea B]
MGDLSVTKKGLRVLTVPSSNRLKPLTLGLWFPIGSRDDQRAGTAHLAEHLSFKGSPGMSADQLVAAAEDNGIALNAYTSRESTAFYAHTTRPKLSKAAELLASMVFRSSASRHALYREKGVVLRELKEVEKSHEEFLLDRLHERAFPGSQFGKPVLGSPEDILSLTEQDVHRHRKLLRRSQGLFAVSGPVTPHEVRQLAEKIFDPLLLKAPPASRPPPQFHSGVHELPPVTSLGEAACYPRSAALAFPCPSSATALILSRLLCSSAPYVRVALSGNNEHAVLCVLLSEARPPPALSPHHRGVRPVATASGSLRFFSAWSDLLTPDLSNKAVETTKKAMLAELDMPPVESLAQHIVNFGPLDDFTARLNMTSASDVQALWRSMLRSQEVCLVSTGVTPPSLTMLQEDMLDQASKCV